MKKLILLSTIIFFQSSAKAQTDTAFWFAAPDISSDYSYDQPIHLRISSQQAACSVSISQPANGGFPAQTVNIPANSTQSIDLTSWLANIECAPANTIQNKGLKISSDNNISVYYEVNANGPNPELFALKGRNSLGTLFYISSQSFLDNTPSYNPLPYSSFNVVASDDNTLVTIIPSKNIAGHPANVAFNITLNKGQTYAAVATSQLASQHLGGSKVTSTKPVAITLCDDLLFGPQYGGICSDLAGDQTVPVSITGSDYIALKSSLNGPDKLYITATQDATMVSQDGTAIGTINAGQSLELSIANDATYVQTSAPAYAYQLSGYGCEVGSAVLPKINCTGSSSVSVVRSTNETFTFTLLVRNGGQNAFLVNNAGGVITAAMFTPISTSIGLFYYARVNLPISSYPNGSVVSVSNSTDIFQCGVLEGDISGVGFGYFSDFNTLKASASADNLNPCSGSGVQLSAGTISSATYNWSGPNGFTSNTQNPSISNVGSLNSGKYLLSVTDPNCGTFKDSINIVVKPRALSTINQTICQGKAFAGYTKTGTYIDTLIAFNGCDSIRTINLLVKPASSSIVNPIICEGRSFLGHTISGTYVDTLVSINGCDSIVTTNLTVKPRMVATINRSICEGEIYLGYKISGTFIDTLVAVNGCDSIRTLNLLVLGRSFSIINKSICSGQSFAGYSLSGTYVDTLVGINGCDSIRTINLSVNSAIFTTINQTICQGQSLGGYYSSGTYIDTLISMSGCDSIRTINLTVKPRSVTSVSTTICEGQSLLGHTNSGVFTDTLTSNTGCDSIIVLSLTVIPSSRSSISASICQGQVFLGRSTTGVFVDTLKAANGCDSLRTLSLVVNPASASTINQSICSGQSYEGYFLGGTYVDTLRSASGCDSIRIINLTILNRPFPSLGPDTSICFEQDYLLSPGNFSSYTWQDGSTQNPYIVKKAGVYSVTVTNSCGTGSDYIVITERPCEIYFPNAFTPNNDGLNENFRVLNAYNLQHYYLAIYDRWGQKVFETTDYTRGWDGKRKQSPADVGTYVWYCKFIKGNVPKFMKGTVSLIR